jgi:galactonate dehydratase
MRIVSIEPLQCSNGWSTWTFVRVETDTGLVGYGECSDWQMPRALAAGVHDLATDIIGKDPRQVGALTADMAFRMRQNVGGVARKSLAGIEAALWDIKGQALGVSITELLGGPTRERIRLYWSHCGSYRARNADVLGTPPINTWADLTDLGHEVVRRGYTALKTNPLHPGQPNYFTQPVDGNLERGDLAIIVRQIETFREAVGPDVDICLDLNFRYRPAAVISIADALAPYELFWIEYDSYDPEALAHVRRSIRTPLCSAENLTAVHDYARFFQAGAMDVAMIDVAWNGIAQSLHIAELAAAHEVHVAPHNYYSHISTFMCAHVAAAVGNLRIMETDVDSAPWRDDLVSVTPTIENGWMRLPDAPGLGTALNEEAVAAHPPPLS